MTGQDRIYSEEEIGRVLQRAAEIQGKQPRTSHAGLSLEELQQLAAESGLDPSFVAAAAAEMETEQESEQTTWWGGPLSTTLIRSVEGRITDETWEDMLALLRRRFKQTGVTERRGNTRQWMLKGNDGNRGHLIATYRDGRTDLEVFFANPTLAIPLFVIPIIFSIIALPIIFEALEFSGPAGFLVWLGFVTTVLGGARTGVKFMASKSRNNIRDVADELAALAQERGTAAPEKQERATPTPKMSSASGPYLQIPEDEYLGNDVAAGQERSREQ